MRMTFSARLSWQTSIILASTMLLVFAYTWLRAREMVDGMTARVVGQTSSQIDERVNLLFDTAEKRSRFIAGLASPRSSFDDSRLTSRRFEELSSELLELINVSTEFSTFCIVIDETGEYVRAFRNSGGEVRLDMVRRVDGELRRTSIVRYGGLLSLGEWDATPQPDLRNEEFYREAMSAQETVWTDTREIAVPGEPPSPGVTCATPINADGGIAGVAFVDLTLTYLSRYVQQIRIGEAGYAFIAEAGDNQRIIAHPDPTRLIVAESGQLRLVTPEELGDAAVSRVLAAMGDVQPGQVGRTTFKIAGREFLAGYRRVGGDGRPEWILGIIVPRAEFMGDLTADRNVLVFFAVIALLAGIYVSLLLAQRIASPVRAIVDETRRIRALDFAVRPRPSTQIIELQDLGDAVEQLKTSLRSFEKLVPSQYARHLVTTGQEAKLGGERRHITISFADIVGFTRLSEMMPPEELMSVLTEYLDVLSGKVIEHGGTVDKFNGDDVMAFWGAPSDVENPALAACVTAVRSQQALTRMHQEWQKDGKPILRASFGIATGDVIVGNVGSRERMNYTVIGDAVNLASRLQGLNKLYETEALIGETTRKEAGDAIVTRVIDYVAVAGREGAATVHELIALKEEATDDDLRITALHNQAMTHYRERRFVEAADGFRTVIAVREGDGPARILLKRCLEYIEKPPGDDWDGAYRAESK